MFEIGQIFQNVIGIMTIEKTHNLANDSLLGNYRIRSIIGPGGAKFISPKIHALNVKLS